MKITATIVVLMCTLGVVVGDKTAAGAQPGNSDCTPELHFWVEEGQTLEGNLQAPPDTKNFHTTNKWTGDSIQTPAWKPGTCETGTLWFALNASAAYHTGTPPAYTPKVKSFSQEWNTAGLFKFINLAQGTNPIVWNGYDYFVFSVMCDTEVKCESIGYINVVYTSASSYNDDSDTFTNGFTDYMKCSGTCTTGWITTHTLPHNWDIQKDNTGASVAPETVGTYDGKKRRTDEMQFNWTTNGFLITSYGRIGSMSARFPTFERLAWQPGHLLTSADFVTPHYGAKSTGFAQSCLDNQGSAPFTGSRGSDVFDPIAKIATNKYNSTLSYYQKFGGKHDECNIFSSWSSACHFAPLLTPRNSQSYSTGPIWTVEINGCDVIWRAKVKWDGMRTQLLGNGMKTWATSGGDGSDFTITTEIFNQAIQPNDWYDPSRGYDAMDYRYQVTLKIASDTDYKFELGIDIFSVDVEWFRYEKDGDEAFMYNLMVYPKRLNALQDSAPDRRIVGFKWVRQNWIQPDATMCNTCNTARVCIHGDADAAGPISQYNSTAFPTSAACIAPTVQLIKGPVTLATDCPSGDATDPESLIILGQAGISAPKTEGSCTVGSFQNITFRGYAPNSASRNNKNAENSVLFGFDGSITLEFLLANGEHPHFHLEPRMYVKQLSVQGYFNGRTYTCRSTPYWPVPDFTGTSLPTNQITTGLTPTDAQNPTPEYLCDEVGPKTFGPTDWAAVFFDITEVDSQYVDATRLSFSISGGQNIFFIYRSDDGTDISVPSGEGQHYLAPNGGENYKYLHFRNLKDLGAIPTTYATVNPTQTEKIPLNMDFGFAWTPGAYNEPVMFTIRCTLRISSTSRTAKRFRGMNADDVKTTTMEERLHIQPGLTPETRRGAQANFASGTRSVVVSSSSTTLVVVLACIVAVLLVIVAVGGVMYVRQRMSKQSPGRSASNASFAKESAVDKEMTGAL